MSRPVLRMDRGRGAAGWHGRAAYYAIMGFVALVVTLGSGLFIPGRHGS